MKMEKEWRKRSDRGYFVRAPKVFEPMLKDENVQKWISKLKEKPGWRATMPGFLRTLYKFSEFSTKSPSELVASSLGEHAAEQTEKLVNASLEVRQVAQKFVNELLGSGKRESARYTRACLTSFFKANGVSLLLNHIPKVPKKTEIIPSKEQVYVMADYTRSLRDRAIILCMYQSGLGITALRNLNYGHIGEQIEKKKIPIRVHVTSEIDEKSSLEAYYTFFGVEACEALNSYLNERKRKIKRMREQGKKVKGSTSNSPLFVSEGRNVPFGGRMAISSIWRIIKNSAEKAGLRKESVWPNCLRKAFEAELDLSPIDWDTKQFLMGHPVTEVKYDANEVEQKYMLCNFSRITLSKLAVIKEFVRSLGIEKLESKIKNVKAKNPQITEEEALRLLTHTELGVTEKS